MSKSKKIKGELGTISGVKFIREKSISKTVLAYEKGEKLRACPFCGGKAKRHVIGAFASYGQSGELAMVRCESCFTQNMYGEGLAASIRWNQRG